jgi:hypothetical protein
MRRWRTTGHENGFQQPDRGSQGAVFVVQAFVIGDCLEVVFTL